MTSKHSPLRVIVVDDERSIADSLALVLMSRRHSVRVAYSGEDAIELLSSFVPHAVISDVMMPGMSGVDLAEYLAVNIPECKTLLVSGITDDSGGTLRPILPKPVHPAQILRFLDSCAVTSV